MHIRPATPEDASWAAPLIAQTIGKIGQTLTGESDEVAVTRALLPFFQAAENRLSFENAMVADSEAGPLGLLMGYSGDGAALQDEAFQTRLRTLGRPDLIQTEAQPGEWYLDTLATLPAARGRGVGSALVEWQAARQKGLGFTHMGLLVDEHNLGARRLYARLDFEEVGRRELAGETYLHLQKRL